MKLEPEIVKAAKDGDLAKIRQCVNLIARPSNSDEVPEWVTRLFGSVVIVAALGIALLAFTWTEDG